MVPIHKQKEPRELTNFRMKRTKPSASYGNMPSDCKQKVKAHLLWEQGYICAYCMTRIKEENSNIEHWDPQSSQNGNDLNYANMLATCDKTHLPKEEQTCNAAKDHSRLEYNPANPSDAARMKIRYDFNDGAIHSNDDKFDRQLENVLRLNIAMLRQNRLSVFKAIKKALSKDKKSINKLIAKFTPSTGHNEPYCGIAFYYLNQVK